MEKEVKLALGKKKLERFQQRREETPQRESKLLSSSPFPSSFPPPSSSSSSSSVYDSTSMTPPISLPFPLPLHPSNQTSTSIPHSHSEPIGDSQFQFQFENSSNEHHDKDFSFLDSSQSQPVQTASLLGPSNVQSAEEDALSPISKRPFTNPILMSPQISSSVQSPTPANPIHLLQDDQIELDDLVQKSKCLPSSSR